MMMFYYVSTEKCEKGEYLNHTSGICTVCGVGYYQDEPGKTSCKPCNNGQTTENKGATTYTDCICMYSTDIDVYMYCY